MTFSQEHRLKERSDFIRCYDKGRRYFSQGFVLFVLSRPEQGQSWRLGMAVTKKTGSSVRRNRVRRLIREVFRLEQKNIPQGYDFVVVPKRRLNPGGLTLDVLRAEFAPLLRAVVLRQSRAVPQ